MIKRLCKLAILAILLSMSSIADAQTTTNVIDEIIWVVGDEAILKSDIEKSRLDMQAQGRRFEGDPYCFIPEQLAMQKLFLDQAKLDSVIIQESDVSGSVTRYEKNVIENLGSKEKAEEYLGAPMTTLREEWREQMKENSMIEEAQKNIMNKTKQLTPSEVRRFYSQLPQDSLPYVPPTVEVQIITREPIIPLKETDQVKNRLREFTRRINSGETSFSTLAIMYSEDLGSATNGGELGFMGRAQLLPEFANVAFALPNTEKVSNVVETEAGFHIIQLIERRGDRANFRHILLRPNVPESELLDVEHRLDTLANHIRLDSITFEIATAFSSDKDTRKNGGLMINQSMSNFGMTPRFKMEELPPEVASTVNGMKIGEVSKPFRMKDRGTGKDLVAIVKLKDRVEGHTANVSDDYQVLKEIVESKKREQELDLWLRKKIKETYVRIDDDWKNCEFKYAGWLKNPK